MVPAAFHQPAKILEVPNKITAQELLRQRGPDDPAHHSADGHPGQQAEERIPERAKGHWLLRIDRHQNANPQNHDQHIVTKSGAPSADKTEDVTKREQQDIHGPVIGEQRHDQPQQRDHGNPAHGRQKHPLENAQITRAARFDPKSAKHTEQPGAHRDSARARRVNPFQEQERQTCGNPGLDALPRPVPVNRRQDRVPLVGTKDGQPQPRQLADDLVGEVEFIPEQAQRRVMAKERFGGAQRNATKHALFPQGDDLRFEGGESGVELVRRQPADG